ncbi:PREDICTED: regulation of nuclear pre-mRNA domain-containing protein 1A-like, partial [Amphimedon queenslandica]|uniref:CID domain-containing protein n=2 Tax=Amphimedon queenslandica TaxID=400682 RepID=A0AAN0IJM8_AMPQE
MAGMTFTPGVLESKLRDLNSTMQSIQELSQWLINNKKHAKSVVGIWFREMQKASSSRKLTLVYLANDVIQNSRRKGPEYKTEFAKALPRALHLVAKDKDQSVTKSVTHVISIWKERRVFEDETISKFNTILSSGHYKRSKSESDALSTSSRVEESSSMGVVIDSETTPPPQEDPPNGREPPQVDVLLKLMTSVDGEKSAIQDMALRQRIANFPSHLYDVDILSKLKSKEACQELLEEVKEPLEILSQYTKKMEDELKERQEIEQLLESFLWLHQCLLYKAKERQKVRIY